MGDVTAFPGTSPDEVAHLEMPVERPRPRRTRVVVFDEEGREMLSCDAWGDPGGGVLLPGPSERHRARGALIQALEMLQPWGY